MSKFHTPEKVRLARKLRKQGQSFKKIASALKISHATVWRWNTDLAQHYLKHTSAGLLREKAKILGQKTVSLLPRVLNKPELKALVAILYWCEGSKYPSTNFVAFCNSDPVLVALFVKLFRKAFKTNPKKFRVGLQLHTIHNIKEMTS